MRPSKKSRCLTYVTEFAHSQISLMIVMLDSYWECCKVVSSESTPRSHLIKPLHLKVMPEKKATELLPRAPGILETLHQDVL